MRGMAAGGVSCLMFRSTARTGKTVSGKPAPGAATITAAAENPSQRLTRGLCPYSLRQLPTDAQRGTAGGARRQTRPVRRRARGQYGRGRNREERHVAGRTQGQKSPKQHQQGIKTVGLRRQRHRRQQQEGEDALVLLGGALA